MAQFIRYKLEDGSELLVEAPGNEGGIVKASAGDKIQEAKETFDKALDSVRVSALQIRKKLHDVQADAVEVKFGLKATGEMGGNMFAVGKVGIEANYEVTLKWSKQPLPDDVQEQIQAIRRRHGLG